MASNHTEHFSLNQWQADDQVLRTDFNEDNAKIDSALKDLAAAQAEKADQTALDALAAEVAKKATTAALETVSKKLAAMPCLVTGTYTGDVVLIDRKGADRSDPLKPLKEALAAGDSLIIFPEGTRRPQPLPSEFKSGLWRLMRDFPDVELIPVYIENLYRAMPKGVLIPVPTICSIRFGAPLEHSPDEPKEEFLTKARQAVIDLAQSS